MIINKSFWPTYPIIGEALLLLAEKASSNGFSVSVVMQDQEDIKSSLKKFERGKNISFFPIKAISNAKSGIIIKLFNSFFFTLAVVRILFIVKPHEIYISTDPPVVTPFFVMIYCYFFKCSYVYHLQDIHPEATNSILPINKWLMFILIKLDSLVIQNAKQLITITEHMAYEISKRSPTTVPIHILNNPAITVYELNLKKTKQDGFSFCGNVGRMQRIPILLKSIETYFKRGGKLKFTFAGYGLYEKKLQKFSENYELFEFYGRVLPIEAARITASYKWALLPIEDEVTRFAFPSKTSSYIYAHAKILSICGFETSVAKWVMQNKLGINVLPDVEMLVETFFKIEKGTINPSKNSKILKRLKSKLSMEIFIKEIYSIIFNQ